MTAYALVTAVAALMTAALLWAVWRLPAEAEEPAQSGIGIENRRRKRDRH